MKIRSIGALALLAVTGSGAFCQSAADQVNAFMFSSDRRSITLAAEDQWLASNPLASGWTPFSRDGRYREIVGLGFSGSMYHPDLFSWVLNADLGLSQWEGDSFGAASPIQSLTANLHFVATLLRTKPLSVVLHADRQDDVPESSLLETGRVSNSSIGASFGWANSFAPVSVSLDQSWSSAQFATFSSTDNTLLLSAGLDRTSSDQLRATRGQYAMSIFDRGTNGALVQQGTSNDARLSNTISFGSGQDTLASSARYLDLTGTLQQQSFELAETLRIALTASLTGHASYNLSAGQDALSTVTAHRGRIELAHQLFDSVTTTLGINGMLTSATSYRQAVFGPDLSVDYRKKTSIGLLNLNYALAADRDDRQSQSPTINVVGESQVLADGTVTLLSTPYADSASVSVTDAGGTVLYVVGVDYTLTAIDTRLELRRVPGGRIANGATVLVSYTAASPGNWQSLTLGQTAGVRLEALGGLLGLSYRYHWVRYPVAGGAISSMEIVDDHQAGISLELPGVSCSLDYQHYGSSLLPYDALRLEQTLSLPIAAVHLVSLQGVQSLVWFPTQAQPQRFFEVVGHYSWAIGEAAAVSVGAGYRLQADPGAAAITTWSAEAGFDYNFAGMKFSLGYQFHLPSNGGIPQQDHTITATLVRAF